MAINTFDYNMDIIAALSDTPNDTMTAAELKSRFDLGGNKIKEYLNLTIVPAVNQLLGFLSGGSLDGAKVKSGTIGTGQLGSVAVTTAKIADGNVTTAKLDGLSVTTAKIANNAVTADKIPNSSITHYKFVDKAIVEEHGSPPNQSTTESYRKKIWAYSNIPYYWNATAGEWRAFVPANGAITEVKIADGAVSRDKIKTGAISTDQIADGAITAAKLKSGVLGDILHWTVVTVPSNGKVDFPSGCTIRNLISIQPYTGNGELVCSTYTMEVSGSDIPLGKVQVYQVESDGTLSTNIQEGIPSAQIVFCYAAV